MIEGPLDGVSPTFAARAAFIKAKLLARRGQFAAARRLAEEGARLATGWVTDGPGHGP